MKRTSVKPWLVAAAFVPVWSLAGTARANQYPDPFNEASYAYVGWFTDGQWIAWFPKSAPDCNHIYWQYLGPTSGFTTNVALVGSAYDDYLHVIKRGEEGVDICGWPAYPPVQNGYSLTLIGMDGTDQLEGGNDTTVLLAGPKSDTLFSFTDAGKYVYLYGEAGGTRPNSSMFCGYGTSGLERYAGSGTGGDFGQDCTGTYLSASGIVWIPFCGC
jgi:hypothetical protein